MNKFNELNLSGSLIFNKEEFAWKLNHGRGTIVSFDSDRINRHLPEGDKVTLDFIKGTLGNTRQIYFVNCEVHNSNETYFYPEAVIILDRNKNIDKLSFDALRVNGKFLNDLYDPIKNSIEEKDIRSTINEYKEKGSVTHHTTQSSDSDIAFESHFKQNKIKFTFLIPKLLHDYTQVKVSNIETIFNVRFSEKMSVSEIIDLYRILTKFFELLLFSTSFSFNKLILRVKVENEEKYNNCGELIINSNYLTSDKRTGKYRELTLFKNKLANYFDIAKKRFETKDDESNMSVDHFIGNNVDFDPFDTSVTYQEFTNTAVSFEHYFKRVYIDKSKGIIKSEFEEELNKKLLLYLEELLEEKIIDKQKEVNKIRAENRNVVKKYQSDIKRFGASLKNKIKHVISDIPQANKLIENKYANFWNNSERGKIPHYFSEFRNKLLHGRYVEITSTVNHSYSVMRMLTYCMLLLEVGFEEEEIVNLIK